MDLPILQKLKNALLRDESAKGIRQEELPSIEAQEQINQMGEHILPEPEKVLRIGEPVVIMKLTKDGLTRFFTVQYYRGRDDKGNRRFSSMPFGRSVLLKDSDIVVRYCDFSPYNLQSNIDKAI